MWHWPYRCRDCQAQRTLRRKIEEYVHTPRCLNPQCRRARKGKGGVLVLRQHRKFTERSGRRLDTCTCDGYLFPHRKGSLHCRLGKKWEKVGDWFPGRERYADEAA